MRESSEFLPRNEIQPKKERKGKGRELKEDEDEAEFLRLYCRGSINQRTAAHRSLIQQTLDIYADELRD